MAGRFRGLDEAAVGGRRVLVRADLNVPLHQGTITDATRIARLVPTIRELAERGARVIILSHLGRPEGKPRPELSLAPLVPALSAALALPVRFCPDCVGPSAMAAASTLSDGEVLLLENVRFHAGEESNDPAFARALAALAELYVNDAFSACHRAHASVVGVPRHLPAYAGRSLAAELAALDSVLGHPRRPVGAIIGGAKVSTKIALLGNLFRKTELVMIGGAMANTFLAAQGVRIGRSLEEADRHAEALDLLGEAKAAACRVLLPEDAVIAAKLAPDVASEVVSIEAVPDTAMILDVGPKSIATFKRELSGLRTVLWNGPVGAFEAPPFAAGTLAIAKAIAEATTFHGLRSVVGGGDTAAALNLAGVTEQLSYVSTAGGAFLEWLEGKILPGIAALEAEQRCSQRLLG